MLKNKRATAAAVDMKYKLYATGGGKKINPDYRSAPLHTAYKDSPTASNRKSN